MRIPGNPRSQFLTILVILVLLVMAASAAADKTKSADQEKKYARSTDASLYVGSETCKTCHEDITYGRPMRRKETQTGFMHGEPVASRKRSSEKTL